MAHRWCSCATAVRACISASHLVSVHYYEQSGVIIAIVVEDTDEGTRKRQVPFVTLLVAHTVTAAQDLKEGNGKRPGG